jgi:hypothetical protein
VLPAFLGATNSRGAAHMAIGAFVAVSMSLFLAIFDPADPTAIVNFAGVYTISFLSVLVCFALAAVLLKLYRAKLARMVIAKWWQIILSLLAVTVGLIGTSLAVTCGVLVCMCMVLHLCPALCAWCITPHRYHVSCYSAGNIILTPSVFSLFLIYLSCFLAVVVYMFMKVEIFTFGIWMVSRCSNIAGGFAWCSPSPANVVGNCIVTGVWSVCIVAQDEPG